MTNSNVRQSFMGKPFILSTKLRISVSRSVKNYMAMVSNSP